MAFFNEIGKKMTAGSQQVIKQTQLFVDVNKLNAQISEQEKNIAQKYSRLGQLYYQKHKEDAETELAEIVGDITSCHKEIEHIKEQIFQMKGVVLCENCGTELGQEAVFCPKCGTRREAVEVASKQEEQVFCTQCGKQNPKGQKFCTGCGCQMSVTEE